MGYRHGVYLTEQEVDKLLLILGGAKIDNADLIKTVCDQTGRPLPEATARWLEEREQWRD